MKQLKVIGVLLVCLLAALTTGLTAQPLQEQEKVTPPGGTDAPPTETAQGGLMWFTDQGEFQTFNAGKENVLKGIENYEESILSPKSAALVDDPLESGVPNLPDGFPFPVGMTGLSNLRVQSNLGGGDPSDEDPRGRFALVAVAQGNSGTVSDIVVANVASDSLDLIFTDGESGVGFDTLTFFGGSLVAVRVYSTTNVFLGMMESPADAAGTNFIGVWSDIPIGRINIYDPRGGSEGGDRIQAWEAGPPCPSDLDGNGTVGASDLLQLLADWGPCP